MNSSHAILHNPDGTVQSLQSAISHSYTQLALHLDSPPLLSRRLQVALFRLPPRVAFSTCFALHRLQCVPVFLNDRWNLNELRRTLVNFPSSVFITTPQQYKQLSPVFSTLAHTPSVLLVRDDASVTHIPSKASRNPATLASETCAVFFTSGTSANPKPVPLSFQNIYVQSRYKHFSLRLSPTSVYLHLAPLYHLSGFSSSHALALAHGRHIFPPCTLHPSDRSHAAALVNIIHQSRTSHLVAVPSTLQLLVDAANSTQLPHVSTILYGGARAQPTLVASLSRLCPNATVVGAYGMSETASSIILQHHPHRGFLVPHFAARVVDVATGRACEAGQRGELCLRGAAVFNGYANSDRNAYFRDGFFRTGDVVVQNEDGSFQVLGRTADSIRSGGETVWPSEVETALLAHPAVKEAAVVGIPHRVLGEAVVAAVVLMVQQNVSKVVDVLVGVCKQTLAHYKCPKQIFVTSCLPRNVNGKVSRAGVLRLYVNNKLQARL